MELNTALIINAGSTTVKYSLFLKNEEVLSVLFEKKGTGFHFTAKQKEQLEDTAISESEFKNSPSYLVPFLQKKGLITDEKDIPLLGFRVVHGGDRLKNTTEITQEVLATIKELSDIAPLHNPPAASIIEACMKTFPESKLYAVFDTAFHSSIPDYAFTYELPKIIRDKYHIRKYGFHGISYSSLIRQLKDIYPKLPKRIVACHLGGGCSISAILDGKSIDTSMGFSPLEGLMMMTRPGDIDAGALLYVEEKLGKDGHEELEIMLTKESGVKGITGGIDDMREVIRQRESNPLCKLALEMFTYRVKKYIGAYASAMGGIDLLVFSGGIGVGSDVVREMITRDLEFLGISLDTQQNAGALPRAELQNKDGKVRIMTLEPEENKEIYNEIIEISS